METNNCDNDQVVKIIRIILIVIGIIMIEIYYATPGIQLYKFYKKQIPEKLLPTIQILTNFLNTINWIISGTRKNDNNNIDLQKIICNSIGAFIGGVLVFYLWMLYSKNKKNEHLIYLFMIFNVFFQIFYALFKLSKPIISQYLSGAFNILMYATPLIHTYYAYQDKNRDIIPIVNVTFGAIASFTWTIYGIVGVVNCNTNDYDSMISNSVSFVLLIVNIIMYFRIPKPKNRMSTTEPLYNKD